MRYCSEQDGAGLVSLEAAIAAPAYARPVEPGKAKQGLTFDKCRLIALLQYRTIAS
jgi:hypothetical protein